MKNIFTFLLLIISIQSFSQDIRLFEQTWYLHDLIIEGESNVPPINNEIPYVAANFYENGIFESGMCENGFGGQLEYLSNTEFDILGIAFLLGGCYQNEPYNESYSNLYSGFWSYLSENTLVNYEIIDDEQNRTLIITGSNNDYAIYGNELLAVEDFKGEAFSIYPNPTEDIIYIQKNENVTLSEISIYNLNGSLVQLINQFNTDNLNINVSALRNGVYFISLKNEANQKILKKIIKK